MSNISKDAIIQFQNVSFGYTKVMKNIDDVSFEINQGEYVCIIGHNGSGKSTISKLITGLLIPSNGKIIINGVILSPDTIKVIRREIGIIFQNPDNQFVGLTVRDDIAFGLENHRVPQSQMNEIIKLVSKAVGMQDFIDDAPSSLSGGQKQRVAIAGVLATNPKIMIFDESTAMLDPESKEDLKDVMYTLKKNYGKTILSVTHDMEEVTRADKVIVVNRGKILKVGTPQEIFENREFLLDVKLDVPFNLKLCFELQKQSKKRKYSLSLDSAKTINEICGGKNG
ncbi:MAG: energy-coupling factor transporter ATPase [Mycoplasmataceae bacterium]|jgi:energy-coupling factor transport system ATP-binding protein|nr:energy-coupling factor transporter ATPase [Mycoplasmataceae bacterium]